MLFTHSHKVKAAVADARAIFLSDQVSENELRELVQTLAIPRHFLREPENNQRTAAWLEDRMRSFGYRTSTQGPHKNIIALPPQPILDRFVAVGAHYDSVHRSPGADDNASALAAMIVCARILSEYDPRAPICFLFFNREEEETMGSRDFVENYLPQSDLNIRWIHILEMIGYCRHEPGTQRVPRLMPINIPREGNFLAVIGEKRSKKLVNRLLAHANAYVPGFPVVALNAWAILKKCFPIILRSDHEFFWENRISATMWTDTAELRNPHYHRPSDTPDTLDYHFLRQVTQLLLAHLLSEI